MGSDWGSDLAFDLAPPTLGLGTVVGSLLHTLGLVWACLYCAPTGQLWGPQSILFLCRFPGLVNKQALLCLSKMRCSQNIMRFLAQGFPLETRGSCSVLC